MPETLLPTTRFEAVSTIFSMFVAAFFGETPKKGHSKSIALSVVTNIWAIISSLISLHQIINDLDRDDYPHLFEFLCGLMFITIFSSIFLLVSLCCTAHVLNFCCSTLCGLVLIGLGIYNLTQLYETYSVDCLPDDDIAFCKHDESVVLIAIFGAGAFMLLGSIFIWVYTIRAGKSHSVWATFCTNDEDSGTTPQSLAAAVISRVSAFCKLCLFAFFWYLVDRDMKENSGISENSERGVSYWMTGQWAKHFSAVANNWLNQW